MTAIWPLYDAISRAIPDRPAIRWRGASWTYAQLADRSRRLANVLADAGLGIQREREELEPWESGQDMVATYLLNGPEYLETTLAGYAARTAPFNVNYRYVADELAYLLNDASAGAVVYHARFAPMLAEVLPQLSRQPFLLQVADDSGEELLPGAIDYEEALSVAPAELSVTGQSPDDLYVLYTGGTTGMPKGTLWRQTDIFNAALGGDAVPDASFDDLVAGATAAEENRLLPNAPFMHGAAQWLAFRMLLWGGTVVINDVVDRLDPADVWGLVETENVDVMLMVGESFARPLMDEFENNPRDVSTLVAVTVGGAATSADTKRRILESLPSVIILDAAGASETGGALTAVAMGDSVGESAVFNLTPGCAILDATLSHREEPGHEQPGWFAKSGHIPLGYLGDEKKTSATFPTVDGVRWSIPGDRALLRADGSVELLGRDSVTINTGGEKVYAEEVEAALLSHGSVADAVVVGRDSEQWGQEVVAVVGLRDDQPEPSDTELLETAGQRIARYKLPKQIIRVPKVLRSPAGKADYRWAKALATDGV